MNEKIEKDLTIGVDFIENIIQNPGMLDDIANGTTINFLDSATPKKETKKEQKRNRKYGKVKPKFELL